MEQIEYAPIEKNLSNLLLGAMCRHTEFLSQDSEDLTFHVDWSTDRRSVFGREYRFTTFTFHAIQGHRYVMPVLHQEPRQTQEYLLC